MLIEKYFSLCRVDLRRQFDRIIGEIPSLISDMRVMPLAATASTSAAEEIIKSLCMASVVQLKHNPGHLNIFLACQQMPNSQLAWNNYLQEDACRIAEVMLLDTQRRV